MSNQKKQVIVPPFQPEQADASWVSGEPVPTAAPAAPATAPENTVPEAAMVFLLKALRCQREGENRDALRYLMVASALAEKQ